MERKSCGVYYYMYLINNITEPHQSDIRTGYDNIQIKRGNKTRNVRRSVRVAVAGPN